MSALTLISHPLCPYVQRAVIALSEKQVPFRRVDIDLADKPGWFHALSPLGKTPVLQVGDVAIFESAVIVEYLEDTQPRPLHPADPLRRAEHRAWIELASALLGEIAGLYGAPDGAGFEARREKISTQLARIEVRLGAGPWFDGPFSLVDAAFAPVFRYFDTFEGIVELNLFSALPRVRAWRTALASRPSVAGAVRPDYPDRLRDFLAGRGSHISRLIRGEVATA